MIILLINGTLAGVAAFFWYYVVEYNFEKKSHPLQIFQLGYWLYLFLTCVLCLTAAGFCAKGMPVPAFFPWIGGAVGMITSILPFFLYLDIRKKKMQPQKT
jgi:hypothetical protein